MPSTSFASSRVRLHVEDTGGNGRPVVLIHGWPLSAESWKPQVGPLRDAGYRVIAYDRRGFGRSEKPEEGYDYDTLTADLAALMEERDLREVTLVGFSMGGGEVARYFTHHDGERLRSVVFAAAVPPCLMKSDDNPDGPLTPEKAKEKEAALMADREAYFDKFTQTFFSAKDVLKVTQAQRQEALAVCRQSGEAAALGCMRAFATADFREDLAKVRVPTLVIHGDSDATVPFEGSGQRTHAAVPGSRLVLLRDAPHGCNLSHADEFNEAMIDFLQ